MKSRSLSGMLWVTLGVIVFPGAARAQLLDTTFTYQGRLRHVENMVAQEVTSTCDFEVKLCEADDNMVACSLGMQNLPGRPVTGSIFALELDFGANVFDGQDRWLEIAVQCPLPPYNDTEFAVLPRQRITAAPYALQTRGIFVDEVGTVGIGISNPQTSLHVRTSGWPQSEVRISRAGSDQILRLDPDGAQTNQYLLLDHMAGDSLELSAIWSGYYLIGRSPIKSINIGALNRTNDLVIYPSGNVAIGANGNVGIGTPGPLQKLDVIGQIRVDSNGGGTLGTFTRPDNMGAAIRLGNGTHYSYGDWLFYNAAGSAFNAIVTNGGSIGIGTNSPQSTLDVAGTAQIGINANESTATLIVNGDSTSPNNNSSLLVRGLDNQIMFDHTGSGSALKNASISFNDEGTLSATNGGLAFQRRASGGTFETNAMIIDLQNGFVGTNRLGGSEAPPHPLTIGHNSSNGNGAHCTVGGVWTNGSDRNSKTDFEETNKRAILAKVIKLPITTWRFKGEPESARHLGPVAQDFHAAFGLGGSETHIGTLDADGVALVAIQGLHELVGEKECQIDLMQDETLELKQKNASLEARLTILETMVARLGAAGEGGGR